MSFLKRIEWALEAVVIGSRWALAPFFLTLVVSLLVLLLKAGQHVAHLVEGALTSTETSAVLDVLGLVDITFVASLVVLVIFSSYENFVSRIDAGGHDHWPQWMTTIDFSGLKLKLMSSLVAISAILTLRVYVDLENETERTLAWSVGIHLAFVVGTVLLALSDRIAGHAPDKSEGH